MLKEFKGKRFTREHAEYIKYLIKEASKVNIDIFGAETHKYKLNKPISIEKVQEFENKYNVKLPEEYVFFVTQVGDGGAGPYYGIYSFDKVIRSVSENINKEAYICNTLAKEQWEKDVNNEKIGDELYDIIEKGTLNIGTKGCSYDNFLMVTGSERGKIVYIDWDLWDDIPPYLTGMTFLEWYEGFFREIILGNSVQSFGYFKLEDEKELITLYKNTNSLDEKSHIILSFQRFKNLSKETIEILESEEEKELEELKFKILIIYKYIVKPMKKFELFIKENNIESIISCMSYVPNNLKDNYYNYIINLLYNKDIDNYKKYKIFDFLEKCKSLLTKDIINFILDKENKNIRYSAISIIKNCNDKIQFIDEFISIMFEEDYKISLAIVKSTIDIKEKPKKLIEAYNILKEKYPENIELNTALKDII